MCGIAGIYDFRERRPVDESVLARMTDTLVHRGPDGRGLHVEPGLGLGHRRLSIIDLEGGVQPMATPDGKLHVTYNGEIYNFRELRQELEASGARFRTRCDTEVILHAWRQWGEGCVERFNGMFAFALWDRTAQVLFLARDPLGIKPLHYAVLADGRLLFASELKALLAYPGLPRRLNAQAVEDYFTFGYVPDPRTILEGVDKLPPGHLLAFGRGQSAPRIRRYWDVVFTGDLRDEAAIPEELVERLRGAVKAQMISDVPLGAFLSGGVDSSAVVAMMAEGAGAPITTCSIAFAERAFDESKYAGLVAGRYGTRHHVDRVDADMAEHLDRIAASYDEPFADSSSVPTHEVCRLARTHVKVALSGDGGDENFAGYRRHRWSAYEERVRALVPAGMRRPLFSALGQAYPKLDWAPKPLRAKSTLQALARDTVEGYLESVAIAPATLRRDLFSAPFRRDLGGYRSLDLFRNHARRAGTAEPLSVVQYLDLKTYLPGDILTKVDRASMAHSLEVRVPLLDYTFVDWAARIAPSFKLRGREGKYIFKKSLEPFLPGDVLYRPKMGFAVPLAQWLRGPLDGSVGHALSGLEQSRIFAPGVLRRLVGQHQSGVANHSALLWALLMFESFYRRVLTEEPRVPLARIRA